MTPSPDDFPFRIEIPARFADLDVNMHLNNTAVSTFYEDARTTMHMAKLRPWLGAEPPRRSRLFVARTTIEYFVEGPYPATYTVAIGISKVGTASFVDSLGLFTGGQLIGACDTVMVHSFGSGSAPIPDDMRELLATLTATSLLRH
ncbi:MAG TPA: thioesterase family protein [Mycobacteriales bacterium]|nr:thioesterase family protein [Mycobacteriales bacterium]